MNHYHTDLSVKNITLVETEPLNLQQFIGFQFSEYNPMLAPFVETLEIEALDQNLPIRRANEVSEDCTPLIFHHSESVHPEGYILTIQANGIEIYASDRVGWWYGYQTLLNLLKQQIKSKCGWSLPCCRINDYPTYSWRGMHLDVVRHFFPIENVLQYITILSRLKFNRFHWHLTDDQGWRIEIPQYPRLQEISAFRINSHCQRYGGYYTQAEIRKVVEFAALRGITVVPEIEMPGHSSSVFAAYPQFTCREGSYTVPTEWGIFEDVYCAGNDEGLTFIKSVIDEVLQLFPSKVIHIGGDECPKTRWKECPKCQMRMQKHNLRNEDELQSWFMGQIVEYLHSKGRHAIGWNEILEGGPPKGVMVMAWQNMQVGYLAAALGHDVVMCPMEYCYFDSYQGPRETEPTAFPRDVYLEKVQQFDPLLVDEIEKFISTNHYHLTTKYFNVKFGEFNHFPFSKIDFIERIKEHILGGQGCVWTEYMEDWKQVEYMLFPRINALAETLWGKETKGMSEKGQVIGLTLLNKI
ncbi:MAG: beta-N-acetylhexosaminidase [bacterium]|nr:beta-N-acetylhexosaminidase [bacterium]